MVANANVLDLAQALYLISTTDKTEIVFIKYGWVRLTDAELIERETDPVNLTHTMRQ